MKIDLKKRLLAKTGKVKCVDFHPVFNWVLLGLYNGSIAIYDFLTQVSVQNMEVASCPIRAAKFLVQKTVIVCGADDKKIRVYNYNTMEKIIEFEAHLDFIRSIVCHIKSPLILSSSDDTTIKLWDADQNYKEIRKYAEHKDFVMKLATNPKDYSMFASCSTDKKIKIWSFTAPNSQMTIEGHLKGVNAVAFCPLTDKPYLASGGDDFAIMVWDYTNKNLIFTFKGHELNISSVCFHPELPLLLTSAEDQLCKIWNINTGKLEDTKIFGYDVIWDINAQVNNNIIGFGCDEATLVIQMGNEEPLITFNPSQGKIIYSQQNNIYSLNLRQVTGEVKDGDIITVLPKHLGTAEVFPNKIMYSQNGRYFSILSDKDFIISTSGVYRSSCIGSCGDLSWSEGDSFIIKDGNYVKIYRNLKEEKSFKPSFKFDQVFGGPLYGIRTQEALYLFEPENNIFIRKIDICPTKVIWNSKKSKIALICDDAMYILNANFDKIDEYIERISEQGEEDEEEEGCEDAFTDPFDVDEKVINGFFINEIFIYETAKNKINYIIQDKIFNVTTLSTRYFLLGYLEATNKIYLMNKNYQLISYTLPLNFLNYQQEISNKNFEKAEEILKKIPDNFNEKIIQFLEKFEYVELAYKIVKNLNHKFSLALKLKKLEDSYNLAVQAKNNEKLKMVADLAMNLGKFNFAEKCMLESNDFNGLLLYYSSIQNKKKIEELAIKAKDQCLYNIAFTCFYQLNNLKECVEILIVTKRYPEAATFCRTYLPSRINEVLDLWNKQLEEEDKNNRISLKIINPLTSQEAELQKSEALNSEFYSKVNHSKTTPSDFERFEKFLDYDTFKDIKSGKKVDIEEIIKPDEEENEEEEEDEKEEEKEEEKKVEEKSDKNAEEEEGGSVEKEGENDEEEEK